MNYVKWSVLLIALPVLIVVFASCSDDGDEAVPTTTQASEPLPAAPNDGGGGDVEPLQVEVTVQNFSFSPDTIEAPATVPFTIMFDNTDAAPHNFAIFTSADDATSGGEPISATEIESGPISQQLSVGPLAAGDYFVWCQVHTSSMTASLVVE